MTKILQFTEKHKDENPVDLFLVCSDCGSHGDFGLVIDKTANILQVVCVSEKCNGKGYYKVDGGVMV